MLTRAHIRARIIATAYQSNQGNIHCSDSQTFGQWNISTTFRRVHRSVRQMFRHRSPSFPKHREISSNLVPNFRRCLARLAMVKRRGRGLISRAELERRGALVFLSFFFFFTTSFSPRGSEGPCGARSSNLEDSKDQIFPKI